MPTYEHIGLNTYVDKDGNQHLLYPVTKPEAVDGLHDLIRTAAPRNLLDNSDWLNPIAQAGINGMHGTMQYVCDRWPHAGISDVSQTANGLQFSVPNFGYFYQKLDNLGGKTITVAYKTTDNTIREIALYDSTVTSQLDVKYVLPINGVVLVTFTVPAENDVATVVFYPLDGEGIEWLAAYEGEYTADNLPAYQPKGYAAELMECQRYYIYIAAILCPGYLTAAAKNYTMFVPLPVPMRITPSIVGTPKWIGRTAAGYCAASGDTAREFERLSVGAAVAKDCCRLNILDTVATAVDANNAVMTFNISGLALSADL